MIGLQAFHLFQTREAEQISGNFEILISILTKKTKLFSIAILSCYKNEKRLEGDEEEGYIT